MSLAIASPPSDGVDIYDVIRDVSKFEILVEGEVFNPSTTQSGEVVLARKWDATHHRSFLVSLAPPPPDAPSASWSVRFESARPADGDPPDDMGVEDPRPFVRDGELFALVVCPRISTRNRWGYSSILTTQIHVWSHATGRHSRVEGQPTSSWQKNWVPIHGTDLVVSDIHPELCVRRLVRAAPTPATPAEWSVVPDSYVARWDTLFWDRSPIAASPVYRGSTNFVPVLDAYYLGVVHTMLVSPKLPSSAQRYYAHRWVLLDRDSFRPVRISRNFRWTPFHPIEFASGLSCPPGSPNVCVYLGVGDRVSARATLSLRNVMASLEPVLAI